MGKSEGASKRMTFTPIIRTRRQAGKPAAPKPQRLREFSQDEKEDGDLDTEVVDLRPTKRVKIDENVEGLRVTKSGQKKSTKGETLNNFVKIETCDGNLKNDDADIKETPTTSSVKESEDDQETDDLENVYEMVAAVINSTTLDKLGKYSKSGKRQVLKSIADKFGATLINKPNSHVVMGSQEVVDKVKAELAKLIKEKNLKTTSGIAKAVEDTKDKHSETLKAIKQTKDIKDNVPGKETRSKREFELTASDKIGKIDSDEIEEVILLEAESDAANTLLEMIEKRELTEKNEVIEEVLDEKQGVFVQKVKEECDDDESADVNMSVEELDSIDESNKGRNITKQTLTTKESDVEQTDASPLQDLEILFEQKARRKRGRPSKWNTELDDLTCTYCNLSMTTYSDLKSHIQLYHKTKQFLCNLCFNTFPFKSSAIGHRKNHFEKDGKTLKQSCIIVHIQKRSSQPQVMLSDDEARQIDDFVLNKRNMTGDENVYRVMEVGDEGRENPVVVVHQNPSQLDESQLMFPQQSLMQVTEVEDPPPEPEAKMMEVILEDEDGVAKTIQISMVQQQEEEVDNTTDNVEKDADAGSAELSSFTNDAQNEASVRVVTTSGAEEMLKKPEVKLAPRERYDCEKCGTTLSNASSYRRHMRDVHEKASASKKTSQTGEELQCPHCPFKCHRIQNFTRHVRNHENPDIYKCDECDYTNHMKAEVMRHKRNKHGVAKYKCDYCDKMFPTLPVLRTHVSARHEKKYSVQCDDCGLVLSSKIALTKHRQRKHSGNKKTYMTCDKCGRNFFSVDTFSEHIAKYHGEAGVESVVNENVVLDEDGKTFTCGVCHQYKHASSREVRNHISRMHMSKDFSCDHCNKAFISQQLLEKHVSIDHMGEQSTTCPTCGKVFKSMTRFRLHDNRVHKMIKNFTCEVCHREFNEKQQLTRHMEIHMPEDERTWKFECEDCGKKFRFKNNYEVHRQDHTGILLHSCSICNKKFKTTDAVNNHMTTHSQDRPHICQYCGRGFKLKKYLDVHLLAHATEKYVCQACGRLFVSHMHLKRHLCKAVALTNKQISSPNEQIIVLENTGVIEDDGVQTLFQTETEMDTDLSMSANRIIQVKSEAGSGNSQALSNQHFLDQLFGTQIGKGAQIVRLENGQELMITQQTTDQGEKAVNIVNTGMTDIVGELNKGDGTEIVLNLEGGDKDIKFPVEDEHHQIVEVETPNPLTSIPEVDEENSSGEPQVYMCGVCNEVFRRVEDVQMHVAQHGVAENALEGLVKQEDEHQIVAMEVEDSSVGGEFLVEQGGEEVVEEDIQSQLAASALTGMSS